jgi:hypothetical protein
MLKNEPPSAQRTAKKIFRSFLCPKPQTFGALGGLGGSSLVLKPESQQAARMGISVRRIALEDVEIAVLTEYLKAWRLP